MKLIACEMEFQMLVEKDNVEHIKEILDKKDLEYSEITDSEKWNQDITELIDSEGLDPVVYSIRIVTDQLENLEDIIDTLDEEDVFCVFDV